jgi:hypothetical protein
LRAQIIKFLHLAAHGQSPQAFQMFLLRFTGAALAAARFVAALFLLLAEQGVYFFLH